MGVKIKENVLMNKRFFTRGINDDCGNESTMHAHLSVKRELNKDDPKKDVGRISGYLTLRDCSNSISLDFYSSCKQKYALKQLAVLYKIRRTINEFIDKYENAVIDLREEGLLK